MIQLFSNMARFSIFAMLVHFVLESHAVAGITAVASSDGGYFQRDVILLITYILLALVFSFLCSVAEAVLLSITPSYIAGLQDKKPKLAALLKKLKQDNVDQVPGRHFDLEYHRPYGRSHRLRVQSNGGVRQCLVRPISPP